ncbi:GNAT family N-acetyltransferase [Salimicrobium halophilum]|uniref:Acetyltransferase (GNAT) family protein n=1 Tax=Salimicrobium halophilum TaxID=86666 RepID=A0A1G8VRR4_9BACI|nr:GNAT family N-acetyltransferase [Salimicrobium halophilum]SDJ68583.1 Acetyltransferase (GNAT) family protein [Salimicrobium halophilum]
MIFRKTKKEDIAEIMTIISDAQQKFRENDIDQWIDGYPDVVTIETDRDRGESYVLADEDTVVGTAAISSLEEKTYRTVHEGEWLSEDPYLVVHRLAVTDERKGEGLASVLLKKTEELAKAEQITSIKIDTHRKNGSMQRLLKKNGFTYCGINYLEDDSERFAYEKII